jgi:hypothetical protein
MITAKNPISRESFLSADRTSCKEYGEPIYLSCFCEDDNLLSQWRAYGTSGGYSLGFQFSFNDFISFLGFKPEPSTYTAKWVKVEYD